MPAPVNTGDFWIVEDTPASVPSCLEVDFGYCEIPPVDDWIDQYGYFGGSEGYLPNTFLYAGDEFGHGSKIVYEYYQHARNCLKAMDYSGNPVAVLHDYEDVPVPVPQIRFTGAMRGNIRLLFAATEGTVSEYGKPWPPVYLINNYHFPVNSKLFWKFEDPQGLTTAHTINHTPMTYRDGYLFGIASNAGSFTLCRWVVPLLGYDTDDPRWTTNTIPVDLVATDSDLVGLTMDVEGTGTRYGAQATISDDGRLFFVAKQASEKYILELDNDMEVIQKWNMDDTYLTGNGTLCGQRHNRCVSASRIQIPSSDTGALPMLLYELNDDGSKDIVHAWTDIGGPSTFGFNADPLPNGIARYSSFSGDPKQYLVNYKGTPDYTP